MPVLLTSQIPGARIVKVLQEHGFQIIPIPGPSALITALSVASFNTDQFIFAGFMPRSKAKLQEELIQYTKLKIPIAYFEAPTRILTSLANIAEILGTDTKLVICAELTKIHEYVAVKTVAEHMRDYQNRDNIKGEYTLIIDKTKSEKHNQLAAHKIFQLLLKELPIRKAASITAKLTGANTKDLYERAKDKNG